MHGSSSQPRREDSGHASVATGRAPPPTKHRRGAARPSASSQGPSATAGGPLQAKLQQHIDREDSRIKRLTESILYDFLPIALKAAAPAEENREPLAGLSSEQCREVALVALAAAILLNAPPGFLDFLLSMPWTELPSVFATCGTDPAAGVVAAYARLGSHPQQSAAIVNSKLRDSPLLDALMDFLYEARNNESLPPMLTLRQGEYAQGNGSRAGMLQRVALAALDGATPLHCAALRGNPALVDQLLAAGADPMAKNAVGELALELVPRCGDASASGRTVCRCMSQDDQEAWECRSRVARSLIARHCIAAFNNGLWQWVQCVLLCVGCVLGLLGCHVSLLRPPMEALAAERWAQRRRLAMQRAEAKRKRLIEALGRARQSLETCLHRASEDEGEVREFGYRYNHKSRKRHVDSAAASGDVPGGGTASEEDDAVLRSAEAALNGLSCERLRDIEHTCSGSAGSACISSVADHEENNNDDTSTTASSSGSGSSSSRLAHHAYAESSSAVNILREVAAEQGSTGMAAVLVPEAKHLERKDWSRVEISLQMQAEVYATLAAASVAMWEACGCAGCLAVASAAIGSAVKELMMLVDAADGSLRGGSGHQRRESRCDDSMVLHLGPYLATAIRSKARLLLRTDVQRPATRAAIWRAQQCVAEWGRIRQICDAAAVSCNDYLVEVHTESLSAVIDGHPATRETSSDSTLSSSASMPSPTPSTRSSSFSPPSSSHSSSPNEDTAIEKPRTDGFATARLLTTPLSSTPFLSGDGIGTSNDDPLELQCLESWAATAASDMLVAEALLGSGAHPLQTLTQAMESAVRYDVAAGGPRLARPVSTAVLQDIESTLEAAQSSSSAHVLQLARSIVDAVAFEMTAGDRLRELLQRGPGGGGGGGGMSGSATNTNTNAEQWTQQLEEAIAIASKFPSLAEDVAAAVAMRRRWEARRAAQEKLNAVVLRAAASPSATLAAAVEAVDASSCSATVHAGAASQTVNAMANGVSSSENAATQVPAKALGDEINARLQALDVAIEEARQTNIPVAKAKKLHKDLGAQGAAVHAAVRLEEALKSGRSGSGPLKAALTRAEAAASAATSGAGAFSLGSSVLASYIQAARSRLNVERAAEALIRAVPACQTVADLPKLEAAILAARKVGAHDVEPEAYRSATELRVRLEAAAKTRGALENAVRALQRSGREDDVGEAERACEAALEYGELLEIDVARAQEAIAAVRTASAAEDRLQRALREGAGVAVLSRAIKDASAAGVKVTEARRVLKLMQALEGALSAAITEGPAAVQALQAKIHAAEAGGVPETIVSDARCTLQRLLLAEVRSELDAALRLTARTAESRPVSQRLATLKTVLDKVDAVLMMHDGQADQETKEEEREQRNRLAHRDSTGAHLSPSLLMRMPSDSLAADGASTPPQLQDGCKLRSQGSVASQRHSVSSAAGSEASTPTHGASKRTEFMQADRDASTGTTGAVAGGQSRGASLTAMATSAELAERDGHEDLTCTDSVVLRLRVVGDVVAAWIEGGEPSDGSADISEDDDVALASLTADALGDDDVAAVRQLARMARRRLAREERDQARLEREMAEEARVRRELQAREQAARQAAEKEAAAKARAERAERKAALEAAKVARKERELAVRAAREQERKEREEAAREHFALLQRRRRLLAEQARTAQVTQLLVAQQSRQEMASAAAAAVAAVPLQDASSLLCAEELTHSGVLDILGADNTALSEQQPVGHQSELAPHAVPGMAALWAQSASGSIRPTEMRDVEAAAAVMSATGTAAGPASQVSATSSFTDLGGATWLSSSAAPLSSQHPMRLEPSRRHQDGSSTATVAVRGGMMNPGSIQATSSLDALTGGLGRTEGLGQPASLFWNETERLAVDATAGAGARAGAGASVVSTSGGRQHPHPDASMLWGSHNSDSGPLARTILASAAGPPPVSMPLLSQDQLSSSLLAPRTSLLDALDVAPHVGERQVHQHQRPCKFWLQGYCRDGDACRFSHPVSPNLQSASQQPAPFDAVTTGLHASHAPHSPADVLLLGGGGRGGRSAAGARASTFAFGAPGSAEFAATVSSVRTLTLGGGHDASIAIERNTVDDNAGRVSLQSSLDGLQRPSSANYSSFSALNMFGGLEDNSTSSGRSIVGQASDISSGLRTLASSLGPGALHNVGESGVSREQQPSEQEVLGQEYGLPSEAALFEDFS